MSELKKACRSRNTILFACHWKGGGTYYRPEDETNVQGMILSSRKGYFRPQDDSVEKSPHIMGSYSLKTVLKIIWFVPRTSHMHNFLSRLLRLMNFITGIFFRYQLLFKRNRYSAYL